MDVRARLNAMEGDTAGGAIPCPPDAADPEPKRRQPEACGRTACIENVDAD
jgi:hypothetical protein